MQQETDHDDMVAIDEDQPEDGPDSDRDWDEDRPLLHARISEMPDMSLSERVVIFCNTVQSCNDVSAGLDEYGIVHVAFHGSMAPAQSFANYRSFIDKEVNLMVTTDIAGRGLDVLHVQHVVMYDFPLNLIDYLHRLGRTGRMGQKGRCTCLIPKQVVPLVLKLAALARSGRSLLEIERLSSQKGPGKGRRERGNKTKGQKPPKKVLTRNQKRQKWVVQQRERAIRLGALKQRIRNMNQRTSIRTTP
jgi:superfamily II DNA/RNA helicase